MLTQSYSRLVGQSITDAGTLRSQWRSWQLFQLFTQRDFFSHSLEFGALNGFCYLCTYSSSFCALLNFLLLLHFCFLFLFFCDIVYTNSYCNFYRGHFYDCSLYCNAPILLRLLLLFLCSMPFTVIFLLLHALFLHSVCLLNRPFRRNVIFNSTKQMPWLLFAFGLRACV